MGNQEQKNYKDNISIENKEKINDNIIIATIIIKKGDNLKQNIINSYENIKRNNNYLNWNEIK